MTWTKICGVRDVDTAVWLSRMQPAAIGLNFYSRSVRYVSGDVARRIAGVLPREVATVGLFVNSPIDAVIAMAEPLGLGYVQFHGDESPEDLARFQQACPQTPIIRAWRMSAEGLQSWFGYRQRCEILGVRLFAALIDADAAGQFGGTGKTVPWRQLREEWPSSDSLKLILAGGLTASNVAEAIRVVQPWGVDTASGVESQPGTKDPEKVAEFLAAVRNPDRV